MHDVAHLRVVLPARGTRGGRVLIPENRGSVVRCRNDFVTGFRLKAVDGIEGVQMMAVLSKTVSHG